MSFLLDTCAISELIRAEPNPGLLRWVGEQDEGDLYLSVVTFAEVTRGVERLPDAKKRATLQAWVSQDLPLRFHGRILDVDLAVAQAWGKATAAGERSGRTVPAMDALIAATALHHGLMVVTRNTKDMEPTGVGVVNPWE